MSCLPEYGTLFVALHARFLCLVVERVVAPLWGVRGEEWFRRPCLIGGWMRRVAEGVLRSRWVQLICGTLPRHGWRELVTSVAEMRDGRQRQRVSHEIWCHQPFCLILVATTDCPMFSRSTHVLLTGELRSLLWSS
jgi:hypothetical protein